MARSILSAFKRSLALGGAAVLLVSPLRAAPSADQSFQEAWSEAATLRATDAHALFQSLDGAKGLPPREVAFGRALTLLDVQPKTDQNIARAADLLDGLVKENPDDAVGQEARFFQARIAQTHLRPADPARAERLYRALYRDHPESVPGQLALEKAALVSLYANAAPAEIPERFAEFEKLGAGLTDPAAAVAFHLVLGLAAIEFGLPPEKALDHLAAAEKLGVPGASAHASNLVRLGRLGQKMGRNDLMVLYWGQFVQFFPHDARNYAIRQELAKLGGKAP